MSAGSQTLSQSKIQKNMNQYGYFCLVLGDGQGSTEDCQKSTWESQGNTGECKGCSRECVLGEYKKVSGKY